MATGKRTVEYYRDGELIDVEEIDDMFPDVLEEEPERVMTGRTTQVQAKRLEVAPDTLGGRTSLVLTADDGSRMEVYVKTDGTLGVTPL